MGDLRRLRELALSSMASEKKGEDREEGELSDPEDSSNFPTLFDKPSASDKPQTPDPPSTPFKIPGPVQSGRMSGTKEHLPLQNATRFVSRTLSSSKELVSSNPAFVLDPSTAVECTSQGEAQRFLSNLNILASPNSPTEAATNNPGDRAFLITFNDEEDDDEDGKAKMGSNGPRGSTSKSSISKAAALSKRNALKQDIEVMRKRIAEMNSKTGKGTMEGSVPRASPANNHKASNSKRTSEISTNANTRPDSSSLSAEDLRQQILAKSNEIERLRQLSLKSAASKGKNPLKGENGAPPISRIIPSNSSHSKTLNVPSIPQASTASQNTTTVAIASDFTKSSNSKTNLDSKMPFLAASRASTATSPSKSSPTPAGPESSLNSQPSPVFSIHGPSRIEIQASNSPSNLNNSVYNPNISSFPDVAGTPGVSNMVSSPRSKFSPLTVSDPKISSNDFLKLSNSNSITSPSISNVSKGLPNALNDSNVISLSNSEPLRLPEGTHPHPNMASLKRTLSYTSSPSNEKSEKKKQRLAFDTEIPNESERTPNQKVSREKFSVMHNIPGCNAPSSPRCSVDHNTSLGSGIMYSEKNQVRNLTHKSHENNFSSNEISAGTSSISEAELRETSIMNTVTHTRIENVLPNRSSDAGTPSAPKTLLTVLSPLEQNVSPHQVPPSPENNLTSHTLFPTNPISETNVLRSKDSQDERNFRGLSIGFSDREMVNENKPLSPNVELTYFVNNLYESDELKKIKEEEHKIEEALENAQKIRRSWELREKYARQSLREAQDALWSVNEQCVFLEERREFLGNQFRMAMSKRKLDIQRMKLQQSSPFFDSIQSFSPYHSPTLSIPYSLPSNSSPLTDQSPNPRPTTTINPIPNSSSTESSFEINVVNNLPTNTLRPFSSPSFPSLPSSEFSPPEIYPGTRMNSEGSMPSASGILPNSEVLNSVVSSPGRVLPPIVDEMSLEYLIDQDKSALISCASVKERDITQNGENELAPELLNIEKSPEIVQSKFNVIPEASSENVENVQDGETNVPQKTIAEQTPFEKETQDVFQSKLLRAENELSVPDSVPDTLEHTVIAIIDKNQKEQIDESGGTEPDVQIEVGKEGETGTKQFSPESHETDYHQSNSHVKGNKEVKGGKKLMVDDLIEGVLAEKVLPDVNHVADAKRFSEKSTNTSAISIPSTETASIKEENLRHNSGSLQIVAAETKGTKTFEANNSSVVTLKVSNDNKKRKARTLQPSSDSKIMLENSQNKTPKTSSNKKKKTQKKERTKSKEAEVSNEKAIILLPNEHQSESKNKSSKPDTSVNSLSKDADVQVDKTITPLDSSNPSSDNPLETTSLLNPKSTVPKEVSSSSNFSKYDEIFSQNKMDNLSNFGSCWVYPATALMAKSNAFSLYIQNHQKKITKSLTSAVDEMKAVPESDIDVASILYASPLSRLRSYRISQHFATTFKHSYASLTWCHAIDPFKQLCIFENRGKCNDNECRKQHFRDFIPSTAQVVSQLHTYLVSNGISNSELQSKSMKAILKPDSFKFSPNAASIFSFERKPLQTASTKKSEIEQISSNLIQKVSSKLDLHVLDRPQKKPNISTSGPIIFHDIVPSPVYCLLGEKNDGINAMSADGSFAWPSSNINELLNDFYFKDFNFFQRFKRRKVGNHIPSIDASYSISSLSIPTSSTHPNLSKDFDVEAETQKVISLEELIHKIKSTQNKIKENPSDVNVWLDLLQLYFSSSAGFKIFSENNEKITHSLVKAIQLNPSSLILWKLYFYFHPSLHFEQDKLETLLRAAISSHPESYELWRVYAMTRSTVEQHVNVLEEATISLANTDSMSSHPSTFSSPSILYLSHRILDLTLSRLYAYALAEKFEDACVWIEDFAHDFQLFSRSSHISMQSLPFKRRSSRSILSHLSPSHSIILFVSLAHFMVYHSLPPPVLSRLNFEQDVSSLLSFCPEEHSIKGSKRNKTEALSLLQLAYENFCTFFSSSKLLSHADSLNSGSTEVNDVLPILAIHYFRLCALLGDISSAYEICRSSLRILPHSFELLSLSAELAARKSGTQAGIQVWAQAFDSSASGTKPEFEFGQRHWSAYAGFAAQWDSPTSALNILLRAASHAKIQKIVCTKVPDWEEVTDQTMHFISKFDLPYESMDKDPEHLTTMGVQFGMKKDPSEDETTAESELVQSNCVYAWLNLGVLEGLLGNGEKSLPTLDRALHEAIKRKVSRPNLEHILQEYANVYQYFYLMSPEDAIASLKWLGLSSFSDCISPTSSPSFSSSSSLPSSSIFSSCAQLVPPLRPLISHDDLFLNRPVLQNLFIKFPHDHSILNAFFEPLIPSFVAHFKDNQLFFSSSQVCFLESVVELTPANPEALGLFLFPCLEMLRQLPKTKLSERRFTIQWASNLLLNSLYHASAQHPVSACVPHINLWLLAADYLQLCSENPKALCMLYVRAWTLHPYSSDLLRRMARSWHDFGDPTQAESALNASFLGGGYQFSPAFFTKKKGGKQA